MLPKSKWQAQGPDMWGFGYLIGGLQGVLVVLYKPCMLG